MYIQVNSILTMPTKLIISLKVGQIKSYSQFADFNQSTTIYTHV